MIPSLTDRQQLLADVQAIRELISVPERWTQAAYARDKDGSDHISEYSELAVCWCLDGAWSKVSAKQSKDYRQKLRRFLNRLTHPGMVWFNDSHTHAEVIAKLDKGIAQLQQEIRHAEG